jgi:hypothetical protein
MFFEECLCLIEKGGGMPTSNIPSEGLEEFRSAARSHRAEKVRVSYQVGIQFNKPDE